MPLPSRRKARDNDGVFANTAECEVVVFRKLLAVVLIFVQLSYHRERLYLKRAYNVNQELLWLFDRWRHLVLAWNIERVRVVKQTDG